ncbi:MAG TPA: cytochrome c oxidase assembly protein [Allosphingosinicella sp.]|nr:cytochrome c oxidase assembly protein [Allosphingosinicella sp.]
MTRLAHFLLLLLLLLLPGTALAHDGREHEIGWTLTPLVTAPLALAAFLYAAGLARLWRRSDRGRAGLRRDGLLFAAGWLSLAGALVSPLHSAGEVSFTMHMIEHEILMLVSALLLVAARPGAAFLWALPPPLRRPFASAGRWGLWRVLTDPFVATAIQAVAIVAWHVPWLFDLALSSDGWHIAQHLSFVGSALLFWWAMLHGRTGRRAFLVPALCLFLTSMVGGGLGALMALASSPWYAGYAAMGMTAIGLSPEQDQQLAGLLMWIPGGLYHLAAALWFLMRGLRLSEGSHAVPSR